MPKLNVVSDYSKWNVICEILIVCSMYIPMYLCTPVLLLCIHMYNYNCTYV